MDSLYLNDGKMLEFGSDGWSELLLEHDSDRNANDIVSMSVRNMKEDSTALIWLSEQDVRDIVDWLNGWLKEWGEKE